jgi:hypothetical protein
MKNKIRTAQTQNGYCSMSKNEKDMGTPKIIAIKNRDVSNAQVTT